MPKSVESRIQKVCLIHDSMRSFFEFNLLTINQQNKVLKFVNYFLEFDFNHLIINKLNQADKFY